ncbi:hypothetical protein AAHH67_04940 [Niallia circulans]
MVRSAFGGPNPKETERQRIKSIQKLADFSKEVAIYRNKFTSYKQLLRNNN